MTVSILKGDCREVLRTLPDESVHCVVTSPPYWGLRDYGVDGQIGLEADYNSFLEAMVDVFSSVRRALRDDGTLWLNLGDSYAHGGCGSRDETRWPKQSRNDHRVEHAKKTSDLKPKDLCGIPWRVALALQSDGWYLRQDIIWSKPNPMPESVTDRCTKAHEYMFLLSKSERYHYDSDAIREDVAPSQVGRVRDDVIGGKSWAERNQHSDGGRYVTKIKVPGGWDRGEGAHGTIHRDGRTSAEYQKAEVPDGRNKRSVWTIATHAFPEAHFATFPPALIEPCILAGCPKGGTVLDPFGGAGTTGLVADRLGRNSILIELNDAYAEMARERIRGDSPLFAEVT